MKYLLLALIPLNAFALSNQPIRYGSTFVVSVGFYRGCTGFIESETEDKDTYYTVLECRRNDRVTSTIHEKLKVTEFNLDK